MKIGVKIHVVIMQLLLLFLLANCSQKKVAVTTKLKLFSGNLAMGVPLNGGILIVGRSADKANEISVVLNSGADEKSVDLQKGRWEFAAFAWTGENGNFTGANKCAYTGFVDIGEVEQSVSFDLSTARCAQTFAAENEKISDDKFMNPLGLFQPFSVNICSSSPLTFANCPYGSMNSAAYMSYRVNLHPSTKVNDGGPPLTSACFLATDKTQVMRIPTGTILNGSVAKFSLSLFPNENCTGVRKTSFFHKGFINPADLAFDLTALYNMDGTTVLMINPASIGEVGAAPTYPPLAPSQLVLESNQNSIFLSWPASAGLGMIRYDVLRSEDLGATYSTVMANTTSTEFSDLNANPGVHYYYKVYAKNEIGGSPASQIVDGVSFSSFNITSANTAGAGALIVAWSTSVGADQYNIRYGTTSGVYTGQLSNAGSPANINGLSGSTTYFIVVEAINAHGSIRAVSEVSATTAANPGAPTALTSTSGNASVQLNWTATPQGAGGAITYNVYKSAVSGSGYSLIQSGLSSTTYSDYSVTNGMVYYYVVQASQDSLLSANSSETIGTPLVNPVIGAFDFNKVTVLGLDYTQLANPNYTISLSQGSATHICINLSSDYNTCTWIAYSAGGVYNLGADGSHNVYVFVKNSNGSISSSMMKTIIVDTISPTPISTDPILLGVSNVINVTWVGGNDVNLDHLNIDLCHDGDSACTVPITSHLLTAYANQDSFPGLSPGAYFVKVSAIDKVSHSTTFNSSSATIASQPSINSIAVGGLHSCSLDSAGTVKCWGDNTYGQLGQGSSGGLSQVPLHVSLPYPAVAIAASNYHTCAALSNGTAYCWGLGTQGRLGTGDGIDHYYPSQVFVSGGIPIGSVDSITLGAAHSCAHLSGGSMYCWGANSSGQLGDTTTISKNYATQVYNMASSVTSISAYQNHTCAIKIGGVYCWGENTTGQLGDGTTINRNSPNSIATLSTGMSSVSTGANHSCAVSSAYAVSCWGGDGGNGSASQSNVPISISGLGTINTIYAGNSYTCVLKTSGDVFCWGYSTSNGYLGDGSTGMRITPGPVNLGTPASALFGGIDSTCAQTSQGMKCWGSNANGKLGSALGLPALYPIFLF